MSCMKIINQKVTTVGAHVNVGSIFKSALNPLINSEISMVLVSLYLTTLVNTPAVTV